MLGNSEKMVLISSDCNEWTQQNNQIDDQNSMASVAAAPPPPPRVMDQKVATFSQELHQQKQQQQQQTQQQQQQNNSQEPLRCPRCDSSNTKFCYYNNYSLSQPRHFCKACKRYWTRGGTLRSVPVGGGCRKNKRVKRPPNNSSSSTNTSNNNSTNLHETSVNSLPSTAGGNIHDLISSPSNPLFYGLPTNHNHSSDHNLMNFPFSRYDLQNPPQINGFGLGFSSGLVHNINGDGDFRNGFSSINLHNNKHIFQDLISSNTSLSNYANTNNNTTTPTSTTPPTISSFLASTFQMKASGGANNNFETILPSYEDSLHMKGSGHGGMFTKDVKMELEGQNRSLNHQWSTTPTPNQMDQHMCSSSSDPSLIWGTGPNLGAWLDPSNNNLGSSVPSLI